MQNFCQAKRAKRRRNFVMIILLMGVSGCGKTTIGSLLAAELDWEFCDADNLHSVANINKMSRGVPLTDDDRADWLRAVRCYILDAVARQQNSIIACSALKAAYRKQLLADKSVKLVYLKGSYELIRQRMLQRHRHFMKPELLQSQFDALEEPVDSLTIDIITPPELIAEEIKGKLCLPHSPKEN